MIKILFSIYWLLHISPFDCPSAYSVPPSSEPSKVESAAGAQPENLVPVRSMGTVVEYFEGNGIGKIKPKSSNNTITVLVSDVNGRQKLQVNTEVTYVESNNPKHGRRATQVEVVKP